MTKPNLRAERLNRGLSAQAAADQIGVSKQLLVRAEKGAIPYPATAKKIADFYGYLPTEVWPVDTSQVAA